MTESFAQDSNAGKVDILVITDNSASMDQEQRKMGERFDSFISAISDLDWQIGITTTDLSGARSPFSTNGQLLTLTGSQAKILTPQFANADTLFRKTVQREETIDCYNKPKGCPTADEEPLRASMLAMDQRFTANVGFFRDGVDFVLVVLSDEDELSDGKNPNATRPQDVVNRFKAYFSDTKRFMAHGIIVLPNDNRCRADQRRQSRSGLAGDYGLAVDALAKLTGGRTYSICASDYGKNLASISQDVRKLVSSFELGAEPQPGSVQVFVTPNVPLSWRIEGKLLIFNSPPPAGARVEVRYIPK